MNGRRELYPNTTVPTARDSEHGLGDNPHASRIQAPKAVNVDADHSRLRTATSALLKPLAVNLLTTATIPKSALAVESFSPGSL